MDFRLSFIFCLMSVVAVAVVVAVPLSSEGVRSRERRDVMDSMKHAWGEVVRAFSDAGDAVVHVFRPTTEKTILDIDMGDIIDNVNKGRSKLTGQK